MTIKEVEEKLNIPRATVRYYEKMNLLHVARGGNSYRDYSDEDIATLKKIIIFRKIGFQVSEISEILNGDRDLSDSLTENINRLKEQVEELNGAIDVCTQMKSHNEKINSFDEQLYWEIINRETQKGRKFLDIAKDVLKYEKKVVLGQFGLLDSEGGLLYGVRGTIIQAIGICTWTGLLYFLLGNRKAGDFIEGFIYPFISIVLISLVGLPLHFLERKKPRLVKRIKKILLWIASVITVLLLILAVASKW